MELLEIFNCDLCVRFVLTSAHFLWQGTAVALIALVLVRLAGRQSSRARYKIYSAAMAVMVCCVLLTYATTGTETERTSSYVGAHPVQQEAIETGSFSESTAELIYVETPAEEAEPPYRNEAQPAMPLYTSLPADDSFQWRSLVPYAAAAYLTGVILLLGRLVVGLGGGQRLRHLSRAVENESVLKALGLQAAHFGMKLRPAVAYCRAVATPTVVGAIKPIILLPVSFPNGLTTDQAEMILAHELAHIKRLDPLVNVLQSIVEALLFFHPAVWFVSRRMRIERENCCDDLVLEMGGRPDQYASSLVRIAEDALTSRAAVSGGLGAAANGSALGKRVRRLLGADGADIRLGSRWAAWLLAGTVLTAVAMLSLGKAERSRTGQMSPWGEKLNGLRMRVTSPAIGPDGVIVYRRGRSVPLELEIQNVSDRAIPLSDLFSPVSFKVTDQSGERVGVQGYIGAHITPWQMAAGQLEPGESIKDLVYLERMRWRMPEKADKKLNLLLQLPTQRQVPASLPLNAYANPITVEREDSPFQDSLTSADLPDAWTQDMEIEYREAGMFFGNMAVRIDGKGNVTAVGSRLRSDEPVGNGRFEYVLKKPELDELARLLKEFKIERLNKYEGKMFATDLVHLHLSIALGPKTLAGEYEVFGDKTPEVVQFRTLIRGILAKMKPATAASNGMNIYLLEDKEINFETARDKPLSDLNLQQTPWISMSNIELFDASSGSLHLLSPVEPVEVPLKGKPFVIAVDGQSRHLGALWTGYSSFSPPEDVPVIHHSPNLWPADVLLIDNMPEDPELIKTLKKAGKYHKGLEVSLNTVKVLDHGEVQYTFAVTNRDTDSLYVLDPDRMGSAAFHYFNNGVVFSSVNSDGQTVQADLEGLAADMDPQTFEDKWFTRLDTGVSMRRTARLGGYPEIPDGTYECSFYFQSPGQVLTKQRRRRGDGRLWVGRTRASGTFSIGKASTKSGVGFTSATAFDIKKSPDRTGTLIDLDKAEIITLPGRMKERHDQKKFLQWLNNSGADVSVNFSGRACFVGSIQSYLKRPVDKKWADITADYVRKAKDLDYQGLGYGNISKFAADLPAAYVYKTREGGRGVFEIVEMDEAAGNVKVRFKAVVENEEQESGEKERAAAAYAPPEGPLDISFVGVCPDESDIILNAKGRKIAERIYPLPGRVLWSKDVFRRDFIFEIPADAKNLLFVNKTVVKVAGSDRILSQTVGNPVKVVNVGGKRYAYVDAQIPKEYRRSVLGLTSYGKDVERVDVVLQYYHGGRGDSGVVFEGPFNEGDILKTGDEGSIKLEVLRKESFSTFWEGARFLLTADKRLELPILIYDTEGRRYQAWVKSASHRTNGSRIEFHILQPGLRLKDIAAVAMEEPFEVIAKDVRVDVGGSGHNYAPYLGEMARRLDLTGLSAEKLKQYQIKTAEEAISVADIVRGNWHVRNVVDTLAHGDTRVNVTDLSADDQIRLRRAATEWLGIKHLRQFGIKLGLMGNWPEFFDAAVEMLSKGPKRRHIDRQDLNAGREVAYAISRYYKEPDPDEVRQIKELVLNTTDGSVVQAMVRYLGSHKLDSTTNALWDLSRDDRPYIWWSALERWRSVASVSPGDCEKLSDRMKMRMILVANMPEDDNLRSQAIARLPELFTVELARMNSSAWNDVREKIAREVDKEVATKTFIRYLRSLLEKVDTRRWTSDDIYRNGSYWQVSYVIQNLNVWYGINLGELGVEENGKTRSKMPGNAGQMKELIAEVLNWYEQADSPEPVELAFSGRVVDSSENGIEAAVLSFTTRIDKPRGGQEVVEVGSVKTDANGAFSYAGLHDARIHSMNVKAGGFIARRGLTIVQRADGRYIFNPDNTVVMEKPGTLSGVLIGRDGRALAGAEVKMFANNRYSEPDRVKTIRTDDEGRYLFKNAASGGHLISYTRYGGEHNRSYGGACAARTVDLEEAADIGPIILDLSESTCILQLTVQDGAAKPVREISMYLDVEMPDGSYRYATIFIARESSESGIYEFKGLPPGNWRCRVYNRDLGQSEGVDFKLNGSQVTNLDVILAQ